MMNFFRSKQVHREAPDAVPAVTTASVVSNERPSPAAEIQRERARCKAIMQAGIEMGMPHIAMSLAFNTNLNADKASSSLRFIAGQSDSLTIGKG